MLLVLQNMVEHNNYSKYNDNKGKRKHHDNTRADPNKKAKPTCWKCGKTGHIKRIAKAYYVTYVSKAYFVKDDDVGWWVDSGATVHNLVSSRVLNNCGYKQVNESNKFVLSKHAFMSTSKLNDSILWHARLGHVHFKKIQDMSKDGLILTFNMDIEKCERGIECIFVGYTEHSKAFRFYVIEPNESVLINSIIESRDAIINENRFSSVTRPIQRSLVNGTKDIGGSVVLEEATEEVVQQPEP
nr:zinc finger, CCHC-type [Tanacetum cinerariifolium]